MSEAFPPLRLAWPVNPGALRLVLALIVVVHHFSSLSFGHFGVFVFFILSGYWVQLMWAKRYSATHSPYFTYMVSRLWRLAPVMILANVLGVAFLTLVMHMPTATLFPDGVGRWALSSVFVLGYAELSYLPIGPAWSLDVEMQYYFLAPLIALLVLRFGNRTMLMAGLVVTVLGWRLLDVDRVLPQYLLFFMIGLVSASARWQPSKRLAYASVACIALLLVLMLLGPWRGVLFAGHGAGPLAMANKLLNMGMAVLCAPFAIYTTRQPSDAADRKMADLSYIIYLMHWPAVIWWIAAGGSLTVRLGHAVLAWGVVGGLSWLILLWFDRPINAARSRWVASRARTSPVVVAAEVTGP